jgi:hypothetical protein
MSSLKIKTQRHTIDVDSNSSTHIKNKKEVAKITKVGVPINTAVHPPQKKERAGRGGEMPHKYGLATRLSQHTS